MTDTDDEPRYRDWGRAITVAGAWTFVVWITFAVVSQPLGQVDFDLAGLAGLSLGFFIGIVMLVREYLAKPRRPDDDEHV